MLTPWTWAARWSAAVAVVAAGAPTPAAGQPVEYQSAAGTTYRAQPDSGPIARADRAVGAAPRDAARLLELGLAQADARQYREAIATFTRGLGLMPADSVRARAVFYRWIGHREISVGEFDRARDDLTLGNRLDSTNYGIWYHLGIARYAHGDFAAAADAFAHAQPRAPDAGELAGSTDWRWMSLSRAGHRDEAAVMLAGRPDSLPIANAYAQRLRLYRGQIGPDAVLTPADTSAVARSTLSYGVGNWYLVRGDTAQARTWFARAVQAGGWPAFGFLMAEVEQRRLR